MTIDDLIRSLGLRESGTLDRFCGNTALLESCFREFLKDETFSQFESAWASQDLPAAITAVHTLKGVAGNLGFTVLFQSCQKTLELLRKGGFSVALLQADALRTSYWEITETLQQLDHSPL